VVPARVSVITLGARDIELLRDFYRGLGWTLAADLDDFAAFLTRGAVLTLYPLEALGRDAQVSPAPATKGLRGFTLAINVDRREDVDVAMAAAEAAGGRVAKEPVDAEWGGRSGYFTDPEGNYWEVAWVPPDSRMARALERATGSP
jgi:uncharacterized protein